MMWNPFSSPFAKTTAVSFADVQSKIKEWMSVDSENFNEVWKKFSKHMNEMEKIQMENSTLKAQLDLTELECNDAVSNATRMELCIKRLEEQVESALSENAKQLSTITAMDFREKGMISTLEAEISLRNDELDEAYAQITNLNNELQAKEEDTVVIINELEFAKEELVAEKNALKMAMEQNAYMASNLELQVQSIKSEAELEMHHHIIGLQTERDDLSKSYSSILSEKGKVGLCNY
jgi:chromosome segregation ATPase